MRLLSVFIFGLCFAAGLVLSQHKVLWNDECYTQAYTIEGYGYGDILKMNIKEGNNSPLFYLLQKFTVDLFHYRLPVAWSGPMGPLADAQGQVVLRIAPDLCMSLALAAIFYFFATRFSLLAGAYALVTTLSSVMVWLYWVEARPYALWFLLTTLQLLISLHLLRTSKHHVLPWFFLGLVNVLLSLTVFSSVVQILIVLFLLFCFLPVSRKEIFCTAIPLFIGFFYALFIPRGILKFAIVSNPVHLIFDNFSIDRLGLLVLFIGAMLIQKKSSAFLKFVLLLAVSFLCSAIALIGYIALFPAQGNSFDLDSRYFIYVAAAEIIITSLISIHLMQMTRSKSWPRLNMGLFLGCLMLLHYLLTYKELFSHATYMNVG